MGIFFFYWLCHTVRLTFEGKKREHIMVKYPLFTDSRLEFLKNGTQPIFVAKRHKKFSGSRQITRNTSRFAQLQTLKFMRLRKTLVFLVFSSSNRINPNQSSDVT